MISETASSGQQLPPPAGLPAGSLAASPAIAPVSPPSSSPWRIIGLVAASAAAVGSFLPWVSVRTAFGSIDVAGTAGDGTLSIACAVIALIGFALSKPWLAIIPAAAAALIAGNAWRSVSSQLDGVSNEFVDAAVGIGVYAVVVGGIVAVIAGWCIRHPRPITPTASIPG